MSISGLIGGNTSGLPDNFFSDASLAPKGFADRIAAEVAAAEHRYHGIITDPKSTPEQKLWARIHARRCGAAWPEESWLKYKNTDEETRKLKADLAKAEQDVAELLQERGLTR